MTDVKISQLPNATTPLTGSELVPLVQNGTTSKVAVQSMSSLPVNTITALRSITPVASNLATVKGHSAIGDGGGGEFYAVTGAAAGTYVDNNGTIIVPTGGNGSSAWLRLYSGDVNVRWMGAKGDGITNDRLAIQRAVDLNNNVYFPPGTYLINSLVALNSLAGGRLTFAEGAIIKQGSYTGDGAAFDINGNNWIIDGATIEGATATITTARVFGIYMRGSYNTIQNCWFKDIKSYVTVGGNNIYGDAVYIAGSYNKVDHCRITNVWGAGISMQYDPAWGTAYNIITNNYIYNSVSAIPQTGATGTLIDGNYIDTAAAEGITVDSGSMFCIVSNNTIVNTAGGRAPPLGPVNGGGVGGIGSGWKSLDNQIINNKITGTVNGGMLSPSVSGGSAIFIMGDRNLVSGNQCYDNGGPGVTVFTPQSQTEGIQSITSVGTLATATVNWILFIKTGDQITISGASPAGYNGTYTVTVTGRRTFTYTLASPLTSPATGTITYSTTATTSTLYSDDNTIVNNYLTNNGGGGILLCSYDSVNTPTYVRRTVIGPNYNEPTITDYSTTSIMQGAAKSVYDSNTTSDVSTSWSFQINSEESNGRFIAAGTNANDSFMGGVNVNSAGKNIIVGALRFEMPVSTAGSETGLVLLGVKSASAIAYTNVAAQWDSSLLQTNYGGILGKAAIKSDSATAGIGYATGAGGTATQGTSRTTGVTIDKICGKITLFSTTTTAGTLDSFTVTNSTVAATDVVIVNFASATSANSYGISVTAVSAGSFRIQIYNIAAVAVAEAPAINFAVIKGVSA